MPLKEISTNTRQSRRARLARLGGAALVGMAMALTFGGVANADETATVTQESENAPFIKGTIKEKIEDKIKEKPIGVRANKLFINIGKKEIAYCIDINHSVGQSGYVKSTWDESHVTNLAKIQWILTNSYPNVDKTIVAKAAKVDPAKANEKLVYGATQAAIWHFSDDLTLSEESNDATLVKIYKYLVDEVGKAPVASDPKPTLKIEAKNTTGEVNSKVGPYTIVSGGGDTTVTATGGKIVDQNGNSVTTFKNGGQFWVTSDKVGTVSIKATGSGSIPTGQVFIVKEVEGQGPFQKIILAGALGTSLEATAQATFTEGKPSLPVTGASVTIAITTGLLLLVGGAVAILMVRRRRVRFTA